MSDPRDIRLFVYPVRDLAQARALFTELLGVEPYFDQPYYVGYKVGRQEIGLDPNGYTEGLTGPVGYWEVEDIHQSVKSLLAVGGKTHQEPKDVGAGKLTALVREPGGSLIGLMQSP